jgi:U3 small nucleolar RNA-associated protein 21
VSVPYDLGFRLTSVLGVQNEITFHTSFTATTLLHPATYLNKVLIGSQQGQMQLWNIRTWLATALAEKPSLTLDSTLIHTFTHPTPATPSPITALIQAPAVDVVGIGYLDGTVRIFDIRQGELVLQVKMEDGGITALAFRMGKFSPSAWL